MTHFDDNGTTTGFTAGHLVRLHINRSHEEFSVDVRDFSSEVKEIVYRDRDSVWIVARAGRLGDQAMLYNIAERKEKLIAGGIGFVLSAKHDMIAHFQQYNFFRDNTGTVAYVNGTMIYPKTIDESEIPPGGFQVAGPAEIAKIAERAGVVKSEPAGPIRWKTDDTIEFSVREYSSFDTKPVTMTYRVSGLVVDATGRIDSKAVVSESSLETLAPTPEDGSTP